MSDWEPGGGGGETLFSARQQRQYIKRANHDNFEEEVRELFNKKFQFSSVQSSLPPSSDCFTSEPWRLKQLEVLKSCLNFHKSQLNDFHIEEWSAHTRRRNPAGDISWKLRNNVNPEFLTQAWTKFYECAYTYNIIPEEARLEKRMVSLHLCEAPGAFISALNHYLNLHHPNMEWHWLASTLNPYYEGNSPSNMISDDRFMFHTLQLWDFGVDNTGNLMDWENSQHIVRRARDTGKVMLVTADGSIDCLQRPDAQEEVTSPLHYCEIVTALQALSQGGTLLCKLFTLFEHCTVNLLYLLNVLFEQVNIYKPVTSKCGNSEVYAVCLLYHGSDELKPYLDVFKAGFGTELYEKKSLFAMETIPIKFIKEVEQCAHFFSSLQCNVINSNLQAFLQKSVDREVKVFRSIIAAQFMTFYDIRPIYHQQEILNGLMHEENKLNMNPRYHRGSYTERAHYDTLSIRDKLQTLNSDFESNLIPDYVMFPKNTMVWLELYDESCQLNLQFTFGKAVKQLNSSKFVLAPIFKMYRQMCEEADFLMCAREAPLTFEEMRVKYNVVTDKWKMLIFPDENGVTERLNELNEVISSLMDGESLFLPNFELLTHFNVGVFYVLCKVLFKVVAFTDGKGLVLSNFVRSKNCSLVKSILEECVKREPRSTVLGVLPVQVTNVGEFYDNVIFYNNTLYRSKSMYLLRNVQKEVCIV